jgi:hypothetical protein
MAHQSMDDEETEAARKVGEAAIAFARAHDERYHEGRRCVDNCISLMAYIAFGLKVFGGRTLGDALDIVAFQNLIAEYQQSHDAHVAQQAEKN